MKATVLSKSWFGYAAALIGIASVSGLLKLFGEHINPTTVALAFLLIILFIATAWGSRPAIVASIIGIVTFNFFFLPPFRTFAIRDPHNWIAFIVFMITAITVGQLSGRVKRRAEEAEAAKAEVERLYYELQDSFERSSQAKALKQSERLKSALLDAVTHDLRTPLTSIKASATTLLDDLYSSERNNAEPGLDMEGRKEMLRVIDEESDRLDRFVEGLTKLARIDAGEMHLRRQRTQIDEIITMALKRAEPRTQTHQMEVWIEDELPTIKVDEQAIAEVIYTLVDNAAKYSPPGSPIRIRTATAADHTLQLSVEDHGPGLSPEIRERVFEKFFRAMRDGDAGDRRSSGTGMGLAIARGIVDAHGGKIWIEDAEGHAGAKFVIQLPVGEGDGSDGVRTGSGSDRIMSSA
jgi:two-component system sensor histidine kinase KdpD